jgi:hypothetical protein
MIAINDFEWAPDGKITGVTLMSPDEHRMSIMSMARD